VSESKSNFSNSLWQAVVLALLIVNSIFAVYVFVASIDYIHLPPAQSVDEQAQRQKTTANNNKDAEIAPNSEAKNKRKAAENKRAEYQKRLENILDRRDLYAQEGMWLAAYALVAITFFQFFVGGAALYYIYQTFNVQKEELDATKNASALQLKPYFQFVDADLIWHPYVPAFENCVALTLSIKNTGQTAALSLSNLVVTDCLITYSIRPLHQTGKLDKSVFDIPTDTIVRESLSIDPSANEKTIRRYFPKEDISRKVVSPNEEVQYFVVMPIDSVPSGMNTTSANISCDLWNVSGYFLFQDSFGKKTGEVRMCKFRAYYGSSAIVTMGDGTVHSTVNTTAMVRNSLAGVLEEIHDESEKRELYTMAGKSH